MGLIAEFVGGRVDGEVREVNWPVPMELRVPVLKYAGWVGNRTKIELSSTQEVRYVRRYGWDGELLYVWDRLLHVT